MNSLARKIGRTIIEETANPQNGRQMTPDESKSLVQLFLIDTALARNPEGVAGLHEDALEKMKIYSILYHRVAGTTAATVSITALLFLAELSQGSPGNAVLFATVIAELSEGGTREVTLSTVVEAFPFSVPDDKVLQSAWESQKGMTYDGQYYDNALDAKWAWT